MMRVVKTPSRRARPGAEQRAAARRERSFEDLLVAKRAAGRPQDLVDVARLERVRAKQLELGRDDSAR
jgi:hypothetical protein